MFLLNVHTKYKRNNMYNYAITSLIPTLYIENRCLHCSKVSLRTISIRKGKNQPFTALLNFLEFPKRSDIFFTGAKITRPAHLRGSPPSGGAVIKLTLCHWGDVKILPQNYKISPKCLLSKFHSPSFPVPSRKTASDLDENFKK